MAKNETTTVSIDVEDSTDLAHADSEAAVPVSADSEVTEPDSPTAESVGTASRRSWKIRAMLLLLVLAIVAGLGVLGYLVWKDTHREQLRRTAGEDATRMITILGSYNYNDVDANLRDVTAISTPAFAQRYSEVAGNLRELIANGKGTSAATVPRAAVESLEDSRAVVLVFLDQQITNVTVPKGRLDASRMVVTLIRDGDTWKLDGADIV